MKQLEINQKPIIKYIPLQQGLRLFEDVPIKENTSRIIKYIPLQQGLRPTFHWCIQTRTA